MSPHRSNTQFRRKRLYRHHVSERSSHLKSENGTAVPVDPEQLSRYVSFLRVSAIAYGLQKHGDLLLRPISTFVPLDADAETFPPDSGDNKNSSDEAESNPSTKGGISATDVEKAAEKNLSFESVNGRVLIGQRIVNQKFYLLPPLSHVSTYEPDLQTIQKVLNNDPELKGVDTGKALPNVFLALKNGFTIEGDSTKVTQGGEPCPSGGEDTSVHLVLRSLIGVMAAAAQEQATFDELNATDPLIKGEEALKFSQAVPPIERMPVLRINWKPVSGIDGAGETLPQLQPTAPLIQLTYRHTEYLIADARDVSASENQYWNRDVFRLVGALTAQVTVDVSVSDREHPAIELRQPREPIMEVFN